MSFRGRSRGRGGRHRGGRGYDMGPPARVVEVGAFLHVADKDKGLAKSSVDMIPFFNAPLYLENKQKIGRIDDIMGLVSEVYFSFALDPGMKISSFEKGTKLYLAPEKLLPPSRFLPGNQNKSNRGRGGRSSRGRGRPSRGRGGRPSRGRGGRPSRGRGGRPSRGRGGRPRSFGNNRSRPY